MSDRGFSIQHFCAIKGAIKGVSTNRPKQKECEQFAQVDVAKNFDITSTRTHVERFIGLGNYEHCLANKPGRHFIINLANARTHS